MVVEINNKKVDFQNKDSQIFCTSLDIAIVFEKRHTHILDIIKGFLNDENMGNFNEPNFRLVTYKDAKYENRPAYNVSRDGFSLLAMSLTGKKALQWKISFINAFNKMEQLIYHNKNKKEFYNLKKETPCRDIVLDIVRKREQSENKKCSEIVSYKVVETYNKGESKTECDVFVRYYPNKDQHHNYQMRLREPKREKYERYFEIGNLPFLYGLKTASSFKVLMAILSKATNRDNVVILSAEAKKEISEEANIHRNIVFKAINELVEKEIILPNTTKKKHYVLNPILFKKF